MVLAIRAIAQPSLNIAKVCLKRKVKAEETREFRLVQLPGSPHAFPIFAELARPTRKQVAH